LSSSASPLEPLASGLSPLACSTALSPLAWSLSGTATQVLSILEANTPPIDRDGTWPKTARAFSSALRRIAPNLREFGVTVEFARSSDRAHARVISIMREAQHL